METDHLQVWLLPLMIRILVRYPLPVGERIQVRGIERRIRIQTREFPV